MTLAQIRAALRAIDPRYTLDFHGPSNRWRVAAGGWLVYAVAAGQQPDEEVIERVRELRRNHPREQQRQTKLEAAARRRGVEPYVLEAERETARRLAVLDRNLAPLRAKYGYARLRRRNLQPRSTPRDHAPRRPRTATAARTRGARSPGRLDDDPPSPPPCKCGCGEVAPPGRRTVDETHATRVRLRRLRDRRRVDPEARLDELARRRLEQFVQQGQTLGPAARLREHVNALADRRLELRIALPSANGDGPRSAPSSTGLTSRLSAAGTRSGRPRR